jgi:hypothetical protein
VSDIYDRTTDKTRLSHLRAFRLEYQREDDRCGSRQIIEIDTIKDGRTYSVLYTANPQTFDRNKSTFEKIVDSFIID